MSARKATGNGIRQLDTRMDCYYDGIHHRHGGEGINSYKVTQLSHQSAMVTIVYTNKTHTLIFSGISCHCYATFARQNEKRKFISLLFAKEIKPIIVFKTDNRIIV